MKIIKTKCSLKIFATAISVFENLIYINHTCILNIQILFENIVCRQLVWGNYIRTSSSIFILCYLSHTQAKTVPEDNLILKRNYVY